jgi:hypothetical protein
MITLNCKWCNDKMSSIEFDLDDVVTCSNCWDLDFANVIARVSNRDLDFDRMQSRMADAEMGDL